MCNEELPCLLSQNQCPLHTHIWVLLTHLSNREKRQWNYWNYRFFFKSSMYKSPQHTKSMQWFLKLENIKNKTGRLQIEAMKNIFNHQKCMYQESTRTLLYMWIKCIGKCSIRFLARLTTLNYYIVMWKLHTIPLVIPESCFPIAILYYQ